MYEGNHSVYSNEKFGVFGCGFWIAVIAVGITSTYRCNNLYTRVYIRRRFNDSFTDTFVSVHICILYVPTCCEIPGHATDSIESPPAHYICVSNNNRVNRILKRAKLKIAFLRAFNYSVYFHATTCQNEIFENDARAKYR